MLLGRPVRGESGPTKLGVLHWFFRGGRRRTQNAQWCSQDLDPLLTKWKSEPFHKRPWGFLHVPPVPTRHKPLDESHRCFTPGSSRSAIGCERVGTAHLGEDNRRHPPLPEWSRCRYRPDMRTSSRLRATGVGRPPMRRADDRRFRVHLAQRLQRVWDAFAPSGGFQGLSQLLGHGASGQPTEDVPYHDPSDAAVVLRKSRHTAQPPRP